MSETHLVQRLASVADLFVNDAFACAHRSTPSIVGFTSLLPCVAGELMGNEIRKLDHALETPVRPCLAVLGGVKVDDSIQVADNMLRNGIADALWPTGGVANLLLDLAGYDIGEPNRAFLKKELGKNWTSTIKQAKTLIEDHGNSIHLPVENDGSSLLDGSGEVEDGGDADVPERGFDGEVLERNIHAIPLDVGGKVNGQVNAVGLGRLRHR